MKFSDESRFIEGNCTTMKDGTLVRVFSSKVFKNDKGEPFMEVQSPTDAIHDIVREVLISELRSMESWLENDRPRV